MNRFPWENRVCVCFIYRMVASIGGRHSSLARVYRIYGLEIMRDKC